MSNENSLYVVYCSSEVNDYIITHLSDIAENIRVIYEENITHVKFKIKGSNMIVKLDPTENELESSYNCYSSLTKASLGLKQKHVFRSKKDVQQAVREYYSLSMSPDDLTEALNKRIDTKLESISDKILEKHLKNIAGSLFKYIGDKYTPPKTIYSSFNDIFFHVIRQETSEIVKKMLINNCLDFSITINSPVKIPEVTYPILNTNP